MTNQHVTENGLVMVHSHEMIATNLRQVTKDGSICIVFTGTCTDSQRNDGIRHTGYNGGTYGGNGLVYTW